MADEQIVEILKEYWVERHSEYYTEKQVNKMFISRLRSLFGEKGKEE